MVLSNIHTIFVKYIYMANMNLKLVRLIVPACLLLSFVWVYGFCTMLEQVVFGKARSLCSQDQTHMWSLFFRSYITPEAVRSREYVPTTLGLNLCITPLSGGISFPIFLPSSTCFLNSLLSRPVQVLSFVSSLNIWKEISCLTIWLEWGRE